MEKKCTNCKYALEQEVGYSNYTVEGTVFYCLKGVHPNDGFDIFYRKAEYLGYGSQCQSHETGEPMELDVDGESERTLLEDYGQELFDLFHALDI